MNEVAYTPEPLDNPNFISRPPDPGPLKLYATVGWDALYHSPFSGAYRSSELMLEKNPYFNVDGNTLSGEEATKKYGMGGQLKFDEPIKETAASLIAQRKMDENDRDYVIGSGETNSFRKATSIPVGMAASLLDPVNTASMFVPVVGEAKFAAMTAKYGGSVLKARLLKGAYQGLVGTAMVEPFVLIPNMQQQANYDIGDSALALGYGVGLGAFLHAGLGAIHDHLQRFSQNDRNAVFEAAMNNVLNDKPVTSPSRIAEFSEANPIHQFEGEGGLVPHETDPSSVETPTDHARYQEINARQAELRSQDPAGHLANEEYQQLAQEIEDIKNRNSKDPGMPPTEPQTPAAAPQTSREETVARIKELQKQAKVFSDKGSLTAAEAKQFRALMAEANSLRFDISKPLVPEKIKSPAKRQSTLSTETVMTAHQDLMANKESYSAITDAAIGVSHNAETAVDKIVRGKNRKISFADFYDTFANTRDALRKQFGDTITLYRATTKQRAKPTTNWATTKEAAAHYGDNIISQEVPIDNVIAVNTGPTGNYHEVIVGEPPRGPTIDQVPRQDPVTGKFLSTEQRIQMLQQQIEDEHARVKLQDENIHKDTQKEVTRLTTEEVRNTTETPKVLTEIQSEIPKLEKEAFPDTVALDDEAKIEAEAERQNFEKELEREIGNPAKREKGVNAGVNCMNNNLI